MRFAPILSSLAFCAAAGAAVINFEELGPRTGGFATENPLRNEYAAAGATFAGPTTTDGGAILNQSGNFGVAAHSGEHFLAFNTITLMANGGTPRDPETISFSAPQTTVSIWAAGGFTNDTFRMQAYNAQNALVGDNAVTTQNWAELAVSAPGITRVVLTATSSDEAWVYDDLTFVPEPATVALLGLGLLGAARRR